MHIEGPQWLAKVFIPLECVHIFSHFDCKHKHVFLEFYVKDQHKIIQDFSFSQFQSDLTLLEFCKEEWAKIMVTRCTKLVDNTPKDLQQKGVLHPPFAAKKGVPRMIDSEGLNTFANCTFHLFLFRKKWKSYIIFFFLLQLYSALS